MKKKVATKKVVRKKASMEVCAICGAPYQQEEITFWKKKSPCLLLRTCPSCGAQLQQGKITFWKEKNPLSNWDPNCGTNCIENFTKGQLEEVHELHSAHAEVLSAKAIAADAKAKALEAHFKVFQIQCMLLKQTRKVARKKSKKVKGAKKK